jgi:hypothetical protein
MESWSDISLELTKILSKEVKKSNGIYFTPYQIVKETIKTITGDNVIYFKNILEPSCGSCQFIDIIDSELKFETLYGVEKNEKIFKVIKNSKFKNSVKLIHSNFLDFSTELFFDLIIGNPPYFVIPKKGIQPEYLKYFDGRPNIYSLFLIKCLKLLSNNGILAFVLPKNFLNCIYYNKLRKEIYYNYKIVCIIDHSDKKYIETGQDTCVFIIQNNKQYNQENNNNYTIIKNSIYIFNTPESIKKLNELYSESNTISSLGFTVSIGNIVWNQVKDKLTDDSSKTLLIYSSDIKNNVLVPQRYLNDVKKNYINLPGVTDKCVVINRGYGTGKYKFNYSVINIEKEYLIENHLIVIKGVNNNNSNNNNSNNNNKSNYEVLIKSFENEKTSEFIELMFGNNAINCQELLHLFPIY